MVRESCGCIIGDVPSGRSRSVECRFGRGSLRSHAHAVGGRREDGDTRQGCTASRRSAGRTAGAACGTVPGEPERGRDRCRRREPLRGSSRGSFRYAGPGVRSLHWRPVSPSGLVRRVRHRDRGPGVDGRVLDPALRSAGGAGIRGTAGGPEGHQECARPQDRCAGQPVDPAASHLRAALRSLPPRRGHSQAAQLHAAASHAARGRCQACPAHAEGPDPDERQAPARHQRHHRYDGTGHHGCHRRW